LIVSKLGSRLVRMGISILRLSLYFTFGYYTRFTFGSRSMGTFVSRLSIGAVISRSLGLHFYLSLGFSFTSLGFSFSSRLQYIKKSHFLWCFNILLLLSCIAHWWRSYRYPGSCLVFYTSDIDASARSVRGLARCAPSSLAQCTPSSLVRPDIVRHVRPARSKKGESTRCSLRGVSAMGTPLVQLSHPVRLRGAGSGAA
jgi:hypothetical protein